MPERPLDLQQMFAALAEHRIDYVVIGGVAVQVHGHRRTTRDLDVIPAPDEENLDRLANALRELEAHPRDLPGELPLGSSSPPPRWCRLYPPFTANCTSCEMCLALPRTRPSVAAHYRSS